MKIAVSGASGFVGTHLSQFLKSKGHEVVSLGRGEFVSKSRERLAEIVSECRAVVNLAGAPINRRWNAKYKAELVASRVEITRRLVEAINLSPCTETLISTSAVGYYPSVGCYDESSGVRGTGFLADLCAAWEAEAMRVRPQVRTLITRFGVVMAPDGGAFISLVRPAKAGVATVAGSGLQPFSWIDLRDLVRAQEFLIERSELEGVFNFAAPQKLTQREFMHAVAVHFHARTTVRIPAFVFRLMFGEGADFLLRGQCAVPSKLLEAGFRFQSPTIEEFLNSL